jgi:hypothetical protein
MDYGSFAFGVWVGFVIACAWYDIVWWTNRS